MVTTRSRSSSRVGSCRRASAALTPCRSLRIRRMSSITEPYRSRVDCSGEFRVRWVTTRVGEMRAIDVDELVVRYGSLTAVDHVSFSVAPGQVLALLGPNGAGKTSTVETLEGFRRPS